MMKNEKWSFDANFAPIKSIFSRGLQKAKAHLLFLYLSFPPVLPASHTSNCRLTLFLYLLFFSIAPIITSKQKLLQLLITSPVKPIYGCNQTNTLRALLFLAYCGRVVACAPTPALSKDQPHSGWLLKRLSLFVSASINIPFYRNYFTQSYFISVFSLVHLPLCYHHFSLILFPFRICFCKYFSLLWFYFLLILFLFIFPPTNILFVMSILSNSYILAPFSPL